MNNYKVSIYNEENERFNLKNRRELIMERFVNDDVLVQKGGRNAVKMDSIELRTKLLARANELGYETWDEDFDLKYLILYLIGEDTTIEEDLNISFHTENLTCSDKVIFGEYETNHLVGFHTLHNGFTFLGMQAGGDSECPVFFIIYYDGKQLRAYIPSYGNTINLDFHSAFGSEDYLDVDRHKLEKKYKCIGTYRNADEPWYSRYLRKYGLTMQTVEIDWNAIKTDIERQIVIK